MRNLFVFVLFLVGINPLLAASPDLPNGKTKEIIIGHTAGGCPVPHAFDVLPTALYYESSRNLTIEFEATHFEPYVLSVESPYAATDYYVTTPFTSIYISPDVANVELYMVTDGGDIYWGSFEASSNTNME